MQFTRARRRLLLLSAAALLGIIVIVVAGTPGFLFRRQPVIVILLDTLRADHLGVYGYERNTSPVLDAFAKESLVFDFAVSSAPWTPASVASIFTGLYPSSHGFMPPRFSWNEVDQIVKQGIRVDDRLVTFAELLKAEGYVTSGISANPWVGRDFNFTQGFDHFRHIPRAVAGEVTLAAIKSIKKLEASGKPFLLYLHYLDPHEPYSPPPKYAGLFKGPLSRGNYSPEQLADIALYDAEIWYVDTALGKFFQFLRDKGLYDQSLIVVLSDHGEQFGEHGNMGHGYQLFKEEIQVPLMLKYPASSRSGRVSFLAAAVDVFPTVLAFAGLQPAKGLPGVSLEKSALLSQRYGVFSEIKAKYNQRALISRAGKKLIVGSRNQFDDLTSGNPAVNIVGLFDVRDEHKPLEEPALLEEMQMEFRSVLQEAVGHRIGAEKTISDTTIKQLKSLGYMD